jgi:competence protein ComEC
VTIAVAFAVGILAAQATAAFTILLAISFLLLAAGALSQSRQVFIAGLVTTFMAAGALRQLAATGAPPGDVSRFAGAPLVTVTGQVEGDAETRQRTFAIVVSARSVERSGEDPQQCSGLVTCTLVRNPGTRPPDHGELIVARGMLEKPEQAGNPGAFDRREYLARRGIFSVLYVHRPGGWSVSDRDHAAGAFLLRATGKLRRSLAASSSRYLSDEDAGLLAGILIGSRSSLPPAVNDDFQLTGTAHVLATAGLHVGFVAYLLGGMMRAFGASRRKSASVVMALLIVYAIVAGGRPSVVRAVLMMDLLLAGYLLEREVDAANSLALAALILLVLRPGNLFDVGFQLSFGTVGAILAIMSVLGPVIDRWTVQSRPVPRPRRILTRLGRFSLNLGSLTVAAQIGSAPLVAQYFNIVSPSGLVANLLIVPALLLILGLGFVFWIAAAIGLPIIPGGIAAILHISLGYVMLVARTCSGLPFAALPTPSPGWPLIIAYYCSLAAVVRAAHRPSIQPVEALMHPADSMEPVAEVR